MSLLCAAIQKYSVSLLRFPFLSHIQVFSYKISNVCCLKYPYSCFSSHFSFLVIVVLLIFLLFVLFLVAVVRFTSSFLMKSSSCYVDISILNSMLPSPLPPSFLDIYRLFMSSLGCLMYRH